MWKSTEYCTFATTWHCNHDSSYLATYSFIQAQNEWSSENDSEEEDDNLETPTSSCLQCFQPDVENPSSFEIEVTTKPHHNICILGAVIVSESRTIECYTASEGYVGSFQGKKVENGFTTIQAGGQTLYRSFVKLDSTTSTLTLKFLSLGNKNEFLISQLKLVLIHDDLGQPTPASMPGSVDLSKVKGYLHSMGNSIPDGAMELLQSVEQYQKTQVTGLEQIQSMMSGLPASTCGDNRLAGLLSVVSKLGPMPNSSSQNSPGDKSVKNPANNSDNSNEDNLAEPASDLSSLQTLMTSISQVHSHHGDTSNGQEDFMYKMLQNICGRVSDMRVSETADQSTDDLVRESGISAEIYDKIIVPESSELLTSGMATVSIDNIKTLLEQTVSQTLKASEDRLMKYIDIRLAAMETTMLSKIDSIVQELQNNGIKNTNHEKHNSEYNAADAALDLD